MVDDARLAVGGIIWGAQIVKTAVVYAVLGNVDLNAAVGA